MQDALKKIHSRGGRLPKLSAEDLLLLMYEYYKEYPPLFKLSLKYGIDEGNASRWIKKIEDILIKYHSQNLSDIKKLNQCREHIVDVTECGIERPKDYEIQREYYSGKKKRHTVKIQLIIEGDSKRIVHVAFGTGREHDFKLFKRTTKKINPDIKMLADSGYQGIGEILKNSITPKKRSKKHPLSSEDKEMNRLISTIRIAVEHVNCQLKRFKILAGRYRNRLDTFAKRAILICNLYNLELMW